MDNEKKYMRIDGEQAEKLLKFIGKYPIKSYGIRLAVTRLRGYYNANPGGDAAAKCRDELNRIFDEHADIAEDDYAWISGL